MRRIFYYSLFAVVCSFLIWGGGFLWFVTHIPTYVEDTTTPTDAIVVLTGGKDRLLTGVNLLEAGKAKTLLVSGVGENSTITDLQKLSGEISPRQIKPLASRMVLGHMAYSTQTNAIETAIWMEFKDYKTLRLVTANYHIPRSMAQFQAEMPNVRIIPHPVFPAHVKLSWWKFPGSAALLLSEYHKFLAVRLAIALHIHVVPIPKKSSL